MKRGHFGTYNPLGDRSRMTASERDQEDAIVLLELLPEFCYPGRQFIAVDELTRGLRLMCETKEIPMWLAFGSTAFLEIHHALRQHTNRCLSELMAVAGDASKT
jgi:hypothetical protein